MGDMEVKFNPLNAELNSICHLLALLGGATIVVVSRLRVNTCVCVCVCMCVCVPANRKMLHVKQRYLLSLAIGF